MDSAPPPVSVAAGNLLNHTVTWPLKGSRLISVVFVADGVLLSTDSLFQPFNRRQVSSVKLFRDLPALGVVEGQDS